MSYRKVANYFQKSGGTPIFLLSMAGIKLNDLYLASFIDGNGPNGKFCPICDGMLIEKEGGKRYHKFDGSAECKLALYIRGILYDLGDKGAENFRLMANRMPVQHNDVVRRKYYTLFAIGPKSYLYCNVVDNNTEFSYNWLAEFTKPVHNIREALLEMMPKEARIARDEGFEVQRQGDIYFIETGMDTNDIGGKVKKGVRIFSTNHVATEAKQVDHMVFVRRSIKHKHNVKPNRVLSLGTHTWWKAVRSPVRSWRT